MTEKIAAEFGISIGAKISEYLVEPLLIRPLRPIFCFGSIVDDFHYQKNMLTPTQARVELDVQRDRGNGLVIYDHAEEWLKKVNTAMQEVQRLEDELVQNKSCFSYSWCPNWTYHYSLSKQASKTAATMKVLCEEAGSYTSVSYLPTLHQDITGSSSSASFIHSQSSRSAFDHIMEALKRDDINLIRLHGRAGAGKTTMARLVGEEAKKLLYRGAGVRNTTTAQLVGKEAKELFDHVIMVPVAQYPLVCSQQDFIAGFLGLQFGQLKIEQVRAAKLQQTLRNCRKKILIIFDDVQKEFNLGAIIGIPSSDSGCKILLTTPHQTVAEIHLHTQKDIQLDSLSEEEAWTLLKRIAGVGDEVRTHDVAKDAIEQCNGLPKAIVAMGTGLNGKDVQEWGETLLQHNAAKFIFIDSLEEGVKKLSLRQDRVNIKINTAKEKDEKIYADVEKWLKDVERVVNDVEQFKDELNQNRWCLDELGVATRVEALTTRVKDLHEQRNIDHVSHPTPLEPDMRLLSSEDFLFSEAAKSAFHQILDAWKKDGVNMIGLYGMGGIGKTTLASQVHNEVIRQNASAAMVTVSQEPDVGNMQDKIADFLNLKFEKKTLDERAIELKNRLKDKKILIILDDVWKRLDLGSIGITLADCKGCKILITTRGSDVCSSMNCQSGIQLCLFSEDESQKLFKQKAGLSNEFELDDVGKQIVGECKRLPIALETVGAALKRKGKDEWVEALEKLRSARLVDIIGVDNDEKNAYKCLKLSYDYLNDQPQGSEAQFILLLCSLFPEDYEIEVEDLARYAFGMKLFGKVKSVKDARRKVRVAIRFLRGSCLLSDAGGEGYVKLHDVVRDVLLWIGATEPQERNTFIVRDGVHLNDLIKKKTFQNCKALSLTSDVIPKFSKYSKLEFPNLEIVLIWGTWFVEFGEGFFEHMKLLKVLNVIGHPCWGSCKFAMPQSLQYLEHLHTLMLRYCGCKNSAILRDLGRLRVLSLRECKINCGVEVVSGLKKLRLLDLSGSWAKRMMCTSDVTERLVKLEELYGGLWYMDEEGTNSKLSELSLPSKLVALSLKVEDVRCLPRDFCFPKLERYDILIGKFYDNQFSSTREVSRLMLGGIGEDVMMKTCEKLLPTVQQLHLSECDDLYSLQSFTLQMLESLEVSEFKKMEWVLKVGNVSNLTADFTCCCFTNLRELKVSKCEKVKAIFPLVKSTCIAHPQSYLPNLQKIVLKENYLLKHIWEGPTRLLSFCNLTQVEIRDCPELICIFPSLSSLATGLQQLEILIIGGCRNLEEIFSSRGGSDDFTCCCFTNLRELKVFGCHKVKAIFPFMKSTSRAPHLHRQSHRCRLPKLQVIVVWNNSLIENIFGHQTQAEDGVECPSLQVLDITDCPQISTTHLVATQLQAPSSMSYVQMAEEQPFEIVAERLFDDLSQSTIMCFSFLYRVELKDCNKLKQVFSTTTVTSLHLLEELIVKGCNELEQVIGKVGDEKEEPTIEVRFENLKTLRVSHCGKLRTIFPISVALPQLEELELNSNAELEHVFGRLDWDCTWQCPFLKDLWLEDCPKLCSEFSACILNPSTTEVVKNIQRDYDNEDGVKCIQRGPTQNICFADLWQIKIIGFHKLKHLFTTKVATNFPNLRRLIVRRCNELEEVIIAEDGDKERENDATREMIARVGFENLEVLHVSDCKKLKAVFSTFMPLPKLDTLALRSNAVLENLFGQSGGDDCTLHWARLSVLSVTCCPKLCTETIAIIKSQLRVQSTTEAPWIINLSNIQGVEELFEIPRQEGVVLKLTNQFLKAEELGDMKRIWSGPTQDISFIYLRAVRVIGCSRLKQLFTTTMLTSLHYLKLLWVERCDDLEQIIEEEEGNEENNTQLEFSDLDILRLIDLPNLISFCPTSCNLVFPHLTERWLKVKGCPKPITDFFSKQSYQGKEKEYQYDSVGEDDDDGKFRNAYAYCTSEFGWGLMGLRPRD